MLVKFHPTANNNIAKLLEAEGAEAVVPDLADFLLYGALDNRIKYEKLSGSFLGMVSSHLFINRIESYRKEMTKALEACKQFTAPKPIQEIAKHAENHLSLANQAGEGWFLTGEMVELIRVGFITSFVYNPLPAYPTILRVRACFERLDGPIPKRIFPPLTMIPGQVKSINLIG